jgi:hypothetical protein
MKILFNSLTLAALALTLSSTTRADDQPVRAEQPAAVVGTWKGQFDSQIGLQKYTFEFKLDGDKLKGKAIGEREMGTNEVQLTEIKLSKEEISFVETLQFGDNDLRIEYKGKIAGDEIKLHRKVADVAEEDFVAKRVKEGDAKAEVKPEVKPGTNAPGSKP